MVLLLVGVVGYGLNKKRSIMPMLRRLGQDLAVTPKPKQRKRANTSDVGVPMDTLDPGNSELVDEVPLVDEYDDSSGATA